MRPDTDSSLHVKNTETYYAINQSEDLPPCDRSTNNGDCTVQVPQPGGGTDSHDPQSSVEDAAPDGGWGWVIVFCSHMLHLLSLGWLFSLSVMYVDWLEEFKAGRSLTSWVVSVAVAVTFGIGPVPAHLASRIGYKRVVIIGGILASLGFFLAFFSTNVYMLIVCIGVIGGCGCGFCYLPAIATVAPWFDKRRPLAIGIGTAGVGIGSFVCAPLLHLMIQQFGWRGTLMIISAIKLNLCAMGLLQRPVPKTTGIKETTINTSNNGICGNDGETVREEVQEKYSVATAGNGHVAKCRLLDELRTANDRVGGSLQHLKGTHDTVTGRDFSSVSELRFRGSPATRESKLSPKDMDLLKFGSIHSLSMIQSRKLQNNHSKHSLRNGLFSPPKPAYSNHEDEEEYMMITKNDTLASNSHSEGEEHRNNSLEVNGDIKTGKLQDSDNKQNRHVQNSHYSSAPSKLTLLKDPVFVVFLFSNMLTNLTYLMPVLFMVDRAVDNGISQSTAALLISINGVSNVFGRIVLPVASDWCSPDRLVSYIICLSVCGLATSLSAFCGSDFYLHALYAVIFGSTMGMYTTQVAVVTVDLMGVDLVGHAFGYMLTFMGLACLVGSPFAGWIFDITGTYATSYFINGIFALTSALMLVPVALKRRRSRLEQESLRKV